MISDPVTVRAAASVQSFMDGVFFASRHTAFGVLRGPSRSASVSFRQALDLPPERWPGTAVRSIMALAPSVAIGPGTPVSDTLPRLTTGVRRLLVMDGGRLVGLLSATDVLRVVEARTRVAAPERVTSAPAVAPGRPPQTILRPER